MTVPLHVPPGWGAGGLLVVIPARPRRCAYTRRFLRWLSMVRRTFSFVAVNGCADATAKVARDGAAGLRVAALETGAAEGGFHPIPSRVPGEGC